MQRLVCFQCVESLPPNVSFQRPLQIWQRKVSFASLSRLNHREVVPVTNRHGITGQSETGAEDEKEIKPEARRSHLGSALRRARPSRGRDLAPYRSVCSRPLLLSLGSCSCSVLLSPEFWISCLDVSPQPSASEDSFFIIIKDYASAAARPSVCIWVQLARLRFYCYSQTQRGKISNIEHAKKRKTLPNLACVGFFFVI